MSAQPDAGFKTRSLSLAPLLLTFSLVALLASIAVLHRAASACECQCAATPGAPMLGGAREWPPISGTDAVSASSPSPRRRARDVSLSPLLHRLGLTVKFRAGLPSVLVSSKLPIWDVVIDAGAFDGADYTLPAYRAGYDVFSFEMSPANQPKVLAALRASGLVEGTDFTVIRPAVGRPVSPPPRASKTPHIYFFCAGVTSPNEGLARGYEMRENPAMLGAPEGFEVIPCTSEADACLPAVAIDDVLPASVRVAVFKLDVQGHEAQALAGADTLLSAWGRVHMMALEWWPAGLLRQGSPDAGVGAMRKLYSYGATCFDVEARWGGAHRPSGIDEWTQQLLDVPRLPWPQGDPIGAWDDVICTLAV